MTPPSHRPDWVALLPLLDQALEREPTAERERWLQTLPEPTRLALQALLDEHAAIETSDFLRKPAALPVADEETWHGGDRLGPWRLLAPLGRGGMATVWRAERADGQFARQVALKLPRAGAPAALVERLRRERGILAQLQHPNIAGILDAGLDAGQPWLALELVEGLPITEHARKNALDVPARLRLFVDVLRAVAHAHAQLVVHRDLKPANVFVSHEGQVRLLDFGVAKLLESPDAALQATALTREAGRALTPQYASPEQISGAPLSTRSDVYSLGVLLYELLTGALPYRLQRGSAAELEEAVLTADVRRPSQAVQDPVLAKRLRGDLDTLVLKALAREPAARYASAEALADDIERHLRRLPIRAQPPSWRYRAAKLWARQRVLLSLGLLASAAVLIALGWALLERQRAQAETRRAEAVQAFLATTLGTHDPEVAQGRTLSARDLLDRGAARIDTDFAADPAVRARLHAQVAQLYNRMGAMTEALRHIDAAVPLYEAQGQAGQPAHLALLFLRHEALIDLSRWDEAAAATRHALAQAERHGGAANRWAPRLVSGLSWIALQQGRWPEAVQEAERATRLQVALSGEASPDALHALNNEAVVAQQTGRLAHAVRLQRRIAELGPRVPGHLKTDLLVERTNLYAALLNLGDSAAALQGLEQAWPKLKQHLGAAHDRVLSQSLTLAQARAERGQFQAAEQGLRESLAVARGRGEAAHLHPAILSAGLARVLVQAGRSWDALPLAREAAQQLDPDPAQTTWLAVRARWFLAEALLGSGARAEGLTLLQQTRERLSALQQPAHPAHAQAALVQAVAQRLDDGPAALALAREACQRQQAAGEDGAWRLPRCRAIEAWLAGLLDPDAAGALVAFRALRDAALQGWPADHVLHAQWRVAEAELLARLPGRAPERQALLAEAERRHRAATGQPLPQPLLLVN
jgi:eukaryotic-like serine/threonine-protein kinase